MDTGTGAGAVAGTGTGVGTGGASTAGISAPPLCFRDVRRFFPTVGSVTAPPVILICLLVSDILVS